MAAIKHPDRETATYRLLVALLSRDQIRLIGDEVLARGCLRYAELFPSPTAAALASALLERTDLLPTGDAFLQACRPYFADADAADCVHAATCLQEGAVLISNDRHFDRIRDAGIVSVWTVSDAIRRLRSVSRGAGGNSSRSRS